ncbi:sulfurtransferase TusA family protein [Reinekea marina]|uniref:Sulfurtransferase TusA family protein n=1 Tax=Reinekea marina TaxID=1310421 RepID=A0ABV7WUA5_9GAMM|nr:sulfurtransferase TusA family protein [Reinekea marina]MDN3650263.1 sulfurtransferase TusA family protein [Reinekea marina]
MSCKAPPKQHLDASGLRCPLPLLKVKQCLAGMQQGERLEVLATDAGAMRDIPAFIDLTSHTLLQCDQRDQQYYFLIEKG